MSLRSELISQQHLRRGVTRAQKVFEQVPGVVPATQSVKIGSGRKWPIHSASIECMTDSIEPCILATALLSHELEQLIGQLSINCGTDLETLRLSVTNLDKIS